MEGPPKKYNSNQLKSLRSSWDITRLFVVIWGVTAVEAKDEHSHQKVLEHQETIGMKIIRWRLVVSEWLVFLIVMKH